MENEESSRLKKWATDNLGFELGLEGKEFTKQRH